VYYPQIFSCRTKHICLFLLIYQMYPLNVCLVTAVDFNSSLLYFRFLQKKWLQLNYNFCPHDKKTYLTLLFWLSLSIFLFYYFFDGRSVLWDSTIFRIFIKLYNIKYNFFSEHNTGQTTYPRDLKFYVKTLLLFSKKWAIWVFFLSIKWKYILP
jgi:hypothetical protein